MHRRSYLPQHEANLALVTLSVFALQREGELLLLLSTLLPQLQFVSSDPTDTAAELHWLLVGLAGSRC